MTCTWIALRCPCCYRKRIVLLEACHVHGFPPCRKWGCELAEAAA